MKKSEICLDGTASGLIDVPVRATLAQPVDRGDAHRPVPAGIAPPSLAATTVPFRPHRPANRPASRRARAGARPAASVAPRKLGSGWRRTVLAWKHSGAGLRAAWSEAAFREEVAVAALLLPLSPVVGRGWVQASVLAGVVLLVLVVELLNSAVEAAVDRVGPEWHSLSKRAKDLGSAAVLLAVLFAAAVWGVALVARFAG